MRPRGSIDRVREAVVACRACPRLVAFREQVARDRVRRHADEVYWGRPVPSFGDPAARLLLVGLAPAPHGANRTGRMFTGDSPGGSAEWVAWGLHAVGLASQPVSRDPGDGLALADTLITSAARCAPPDNRPAADELTRCRPYLVAELRAMPALRAILALGRIAHDAVLAAWAEAGLGAARAGGAARPRFAHGALAWLPRQAGGPVALLASYHPSRQNTQTGRLTREMWLTVLRRAAALREAGPPR